jgi:hypothetical protein
MQMQRRTPTAAVTGPAAWENGRDQVETPSSRPARPRPTSTRARRPAVAANQPPPEPPRGTHVKSHYGAAQVRPVSFRLHTDVQVIETVGVNPDPPAQRQAAPEISPTIPYSEDSPTGYDPYTMGTF